MGRREISTFLVAIFACVYLGHKCLTAVPRTASRTTHLILTASKLVEIKTWLFVTKGKLNFLHSLVKELTNRVCLAGGVALVTLSKNCESSYFTHHPAEVPETHTNSVKGLGYLCYSSLYVDLGILGMKFWLCTKNTRTVCMQLVGVWLMLGSLLLSAMMADWSLTMFPHRKNMPSSPHDAAAVFHRKKSLCVTVRRMCLFNHFLQGENMQYII